MLKLQELARNRLNSDKQPKILLEEHGATQDHIYKSNQHKPSIPVLTAPKYQECNTNEQNPRSYYSNIKIPNLFNFKIFIRKAKVEEVNTQRMKATLLTLLH